MTFKNTFKTTKNRAGIAFFSVFITLSLSACGTQSLGSILGFEKLPPDEFLSIKLPDFTVPPILAIPAPADGSSGNKKDSLVLLSQLQQSAIVKRNDNLKEDSAFLDSLNLSNEREDIASVRNNLDALVLGLIQLNDYQFTALSEKPGKTISQNVSITFEGN